MKADDEGLAVSLSRRIYSRELLSGKPLQSTQETLPRGPSQHSHPESTSFPTEAGRREGAPPAFLGVKEDLGRQALGPSAEDTQRGWSRPAGSWLEGCQEGKQEGPCNWSRPYRIKTLFFKPSKDVPRIFKFIL